ncbi:TspO/MBR family protein [Oryzicola mucosus]|uniref:Tryptophan-rich sensory protein n=1 Tax=Oryzicola mucosus TaxID=2767425 RepID=A0A8J6PKP8_9HYPH|nr:TspO/MBR family protein [Oryzicola mucosus]MBD0413047.1 tryptophan-rich sensory protein [Oryzicola mucosus]
MQKNYLSLAVFIAVVLGIGLLIGFVTLPGEWYASLQKPAFNPPNWVFGPAWTILYILIGIAGWRIWEIDRYGGAMKLWLLQMALNFCWSPAFFGAQRIGLALVIIFLLLLTILAFIGVAARRDKMAALLFVPYAGWVAFATALNASIWMLN